MFSLYNFLYICAFLHLLENYVYLSKGAPSHFKNAIFCIVCLLKYCNHALENLTLIPMSFKKF